MQAETLETQVLGAGPITTEDALKLVDDPRTDVYAAIQATDGAVLKFGRSRRFASPLQNLALALRDGGMCAKPGCSAPWHGSDADHIVEWDNGGLTDIENLRPLCTCECHPDRHETGTSISRQPDGAWTVDGETFPPWPPPRPAQPVDDDADAVYQRRLCLLRRAAGRPDLFPEPTYA